MTPMLALSVFNVLCLIGSVTFAVRATRSARRAGQHAAVALRSREIDGSAVLVLDFPVQPATYHRPPF